ncbi:MAG: signal peptidase I [Nitrososphaeria archaeon]|nr:signal peptidase I [Nitrososphaeria archaeon]NIT03956.1 signal peptidase I [Candidatus Saccharibacteria bacterium]
MIAALAVIALVTALSALEIPNGIRLYTVQSGSMAPTIPAGSIVLVKPAAEYREGDVITFKSASERYLEKPTSTITHRIYKVLEEEGKVVYLSKGDFNPSPDSEPVTRELVLGKVIFSVPLIGYPVSFARTVPGLVILIVIPATILIYSEILNIKKELVRIRREKRKRAKKPKEV